ncbi:hypothetical protein BJ508DRAFT_417271 [Ascobolus immersus RN42]|uniref:Uncharacterized protein n=1 Tax=Ascobolus immersus RN42 TaxID=1160509 RepID=A0A3N4HVR9_ASCIM|nr:hypothetical protein BJ508DRAFT_417271 [Ascobolus immersus RN42]
MSFNATINGSPLSHKVTKSVIHLGPKLDQVLPAYIPSLLEPVRAVSYGPQGSKWATASGSRSNTSSSPASSRYGHSASAGDRAAFSGHNGFAINANRAKFIAESSGLNKAPVNKGGARASQVGWYGQDETDSDFVKNFYKNAERNGGGSGFAAGVGAGREERAGNGYKGYDGGMENEDEIL